MSPDEAPTRWNQRLLFAPTDARMVALLRMALAAMLAWAFWSVGMQLRWPWPWVPGLDIAYERLFLTRWYAAGVLGMLAMLGLGIRPRLIGLALVAMLLPLAFLERGQQSRQVLLFALLAFSLLRSDAQLSLRSWRSGDAPATAGPIWPIRLMQLQLCIVYLINAIAKSTPAYLSGEVLMGMARMRGNFHVDFTDGHLSIGALTVPVALAAICSVVVEYFLAIGFWVPRLRIPTAAVGVGFHLLLMWIMTIFMLDLTSLFLYLVFLLPLRLRPSQGK